VSDERHQVGDVWEGPHGDAFEVIEVIDRRPFPTGLVMKPDANVTASWLRARGWFRTDDDECQKCKRPPDARNHVAGSVFVGWGHGWQTCNTCFGSQRVPRSS